MASSLYSRAKKLLPRRLKTRLKNSRSVQLYELAAMKRGAGLDSIEAIARSIQTLPTEEYLQALGSPRSEISRLARHSSVAVEINNSCNLNCVMCNTAESPRRKGIMDPQLFETVVKKLKTAGVNSIHSIHTIGDPFANKHLRLYLETMRKHDMYLGTLSSNCLLMERHLQTIFEFRDVIVTIRPSIDAASKAVYEKIRVGGSWEQLLRSLTAFADRNARSTPPFPVWIHSIVSDDNFHELAFIPSVFSFLTPPHRVRFDLVASSRLAHEYFFNCRIGGGSHVLRAPCSYLWYNIYVLIDGTLSACCADYHGDVVFGNILDDDWEKSFNGKRIQRLRRASLRADPNSMPLSCRSCYIDDPRYSQLIEAIFNYFFLRIRKHPVYLQETLNRLRPAVKRGDFDKVLEVVKGL